VPGSTRSARRTPASTKAADTNADADAAARAADAGDDRARVARRRSLQRRLRLPTRVAERRALDVGDISMLNLKSNCETSFSHYMCNGQVSRRV
jgi:hypothetical protein